MGVNDTFVIQRERIKNLFVRQFPKFEIEFRPEDDRMISEFCIRVVEKDTKRIIGAVPEDNQWGVTNVADWSDAKILNKIGQIIKINQQRDL